MKLNNVYLVGTGAFLPGNPVTNDEIDQYIQPINNQSSRIKNKILRENGIQNRYYGIDKDGKTQFSLTTMGCEASNAALRDAGIGLADLGMLCAGTVGGDQPVPGFANRLQGALKAPPLETSSHTGICASGVIALKHAAQSIELGEHKKALVVAAEFPSRMFKKTRFAASNYDVDFDSHFLRWMLSDGAGACVLSNNPHPLRPSLKLLMAHVQSFSGDYPTCMQIGSPVGDDNISYLDYDSFAEAEIKGAFLLRQNIRLLPHLFDIGIHEYAKVVREHDIDPNQIDHFLCHYSSEKFIPVVRDLMDKAHLSIPQERWFSNLKTKGNTGSASIFIMLDEFMREKKPKPGEKIFCYIPESGRFTVSYLMFEVVAPSEHFKKSEPVSKSSKNGVLSEAHKAPGVAWTSEQSNLKPRVAHLLRELAVVWHDYRSRAWRSPYYEMILSGKIQPQNYLKWMESWIPQVREGSLWMRKAVTNLTEPYGFLKETIELHASEEQNDWKILLQDYQNAGGLKTSDQLSKNRGGEALNAFMHYRASQKNAVDLLGGIYIIEGTGQRIIPALLPQLKSQLSQLGPECFKFLQYHGENDENHLNRWLAAVSYVLEQSQVHSRTGVDSEETGADELINSIIDTAKTVADLYLLQLQNV